MTSCIASLPRLGIYHEVIETMTNASHASAQDFNSTVESLLNKTKNIIRVTSVNSTKPRYHMNCTYTDVLFLCGVEKIMVSMSTTSRESDSES